MMEKVVNGVIFGAPDIRKKILSDFSMADAACTPCVEGQVGQE
jgi:hypothetical protein